MGSKCPPYGNWECAYQFLCVPPYLWFVALSRFDFKLRPARFAPKGSLKTICRLSGCLFCASGGQRSFAPIFSACATSLATAASTASSVSVAFWSCSRIFTAMLLWFSGSPVPRYTSNSSISRTSGLSARARAAASSAYDTVSGRTNAKSRRTGWNLDTGR